MNLNQVTLIGALLDTPKVTRQLNGKATTTFSIETGDTSADVHVVVARGTVGDVAAKYLKVGSRVYVVGRTNSAEVVADNLILLGRRSASAKPAQQ